MKLAFNYLNETLDLIKQGKISLDYLKYPSISKSNINDIRKIRQEYDEDILLHGLIQKNYTEILSDSFISSVNIDETKEAIKLTNTPGLSLHLNTDKKLLNLSQDELLNILKNNMEYIKHTFNNVGFYSLENKEKSINKNIITPEFITKAINITNTNLLLDLSHAKGASMSLGIKINEYVDKLPLDKINEIHINGWESIEDKFVSHIKINKEALELLKYVLNGCNPDILTIEYGYTKENYLKKFNNDLKYEGRYNFCSLNTINKKVEDDVIEQIQNIKPLIKR